jgi:SAM-dependent methyltransferase
MSRWGSPETVAGFAGAPPNATLLRFVEGEARRAPRPAVLDLGCGAGRNAVPLAALGCRVLGTDLERPMLLAAARRAAAAGVAPGTLWVQAAMDRLPCRARAFDVVVAHGIFNLAASAAELRRALAEAARVARPGAGLFLFTFSRHTLGPEAVPVPGEAFVFTDFAGEPQCFLTEAQALEELGAVGFERDPPGPLTEHNRPRPGTLGTGAPVIYEGTFRYQP